MTIERLEELAVECEREGRKAQARLLRDVILDIKRGSPWLDLLNRGIV